MLIILIASALLFDFLNGYNDSSSIVATVIASRAMSPRRALTLTALSEFAGPFLFGVAVATTVGKGLIESVAVTLPVVLAGVLAAILWNRVTWFFAVPSSSSHALVGGLMGAAILAAGPGAVHLSGLIKVLLALFLAPPLGMAAGFLLMRLILFLAQLATPRINDWFRQGQLFTSIGLALSHGANDSQKTMGIITLALVASGALNTFAVPLWVIVVSAGAISLGTLLGGWRLIRTLGGRIYTIRPVHGFAAHIAATGVILGAALLGGPVSTTQVISSAIMGVGSAERISKVRWEVGQEMLQAWFLTIPATMAAGAAIFWIIHRLGY
ncbi:MAG: inorganic phosphate transporter [Chloroflexi bacterium]|nr:inorganic phosphate transporter [Chloroflexota bacterium]